MIIYIDETENEHYFIVAGVLVDSETKIQQVYRRFKNSIRGNKISPEHKARLFTEFKSVLLDNTYQRIKVRMLEVLSEIDGTVIYSCYSKKTARMNQVLKESVYITLFSRIIAAIPFNSTVVFDSFGKKDFEERIIQSVENFDNIERVYCSNSQTEPGLQFADNVCSVIRLHKSKSEKDIFYEIIERFTIEL